MEKETAVELSVTHSALNLLDVFEQFTTNMEEKETVHIEIIQPDKDPRIPSRRLR